MSSVGVDAPVRRRRPRDLVGKFWAHFRGNPEPGIESDRSRPTNTCVIKVLVGPNVFEGWRSQVKSYYEVIQALENYEKRVRAGEKNVQVFIYTFCLEFLTSEWAKRASIIFVAPTDHAVCINHLIAGKHKIYGTKYQHYTQFAELALSGKLD